jgi:uncharacterized protein YecT (DUF1311 family)
MSQTRRLAALLAALLVPLAATFFLGGGAARAQTPRPSAALCDQTKLIATAWDDCLRKGQADTDKGVDEALARFKAAIDARADLTGQQRALLKRQIGDSNDLWIRYRNHLCQNVLPILAGPKAKIYEENLGCIIDLNTARIRDLQALIAPR